MRRSKLKFLFLLLDIIAICQSIIISYLILFKSLDRFLTNMLPRLPIDDAILWSIFILVTFYILDLYNLSPGFGTKIMMKVLASVAAAGILYTVFSYVLLHLFIGRSLFVLQILFIATFTTLWRLGYIGIQRQFEKPKNILLVGPRGILSSIAYELKKTNRYSVEKYPYSYKSKNLPPSEKISKMKSLNVVFVDDPKMPDDVMQDLMQFRLKGIPVREIADFYEDEWEKVPVLLLKDRWFVYSHGFTVIHHLFYQRVKRVVDVILAILGMAVTGPFMLLTAALIKIESRGPVFYKQERVGLNERPFGLIKFRSMVKDAEKSGAAWAGKKDPRLTRVGRFMRLFRWDELPQLLNILKGEMSFIGPRPERPVFVEGLKKEIPYYSYRHLVKPGLTGWAQVSYPYGASVEDAMRKLEYDLYYIKNSNFLLDLQIIFRTLRVILFRLGSR